MLMIVLNDAYDSEDFVRLKDYRKYTGDEPRGNAFAIQDYIHDFRGSLEAIHDGRCCRAGTFPLAVWGVIQNRCDR